MQSGVSEVPGVLVLTFNYNHDELGILGRVSEWFHIYI